MLVSYYHLFADDECKLYGTAYCTRSSCYCYSIFCFWFLNVAPAVTYNAFLPSILGCQMKLIQNLTPFLLRTTNEFSCYNVRDMQSPGACSYVIVLISILTGDGEQKKNQKVVQRPTFRDFSFTTSVLYGSRAPSIEPEVVLHRTLSLYLLLSCSVEPIVNIPCKIDRKRKEKD